MSKRVFLDIGHGSDTYANGGGKGIIKPNGELFQEHQFNSDVFLALQKELIEQGFEVDYKQAPHSKEIGLRKRSSYINLEHEKDPYLCVVSLHANAGSPNAKGYGVFYWHNSEGGKRLATLWDKYAKEILDIKPWGQALWKCIPNTWSDFHMVRVPTPVCILVEHFFFTNFEELEKCNKPDYIKKFAKVTAKAICEYASVKYKEKEENREMTPWEKEIQESVEWAKKEKISDGTRLDDPVTRKEAIVMFHRFFKLLQK